MTLYEIDSQMQGILDAIESAGGEITPEQEYALEQLEMSRNDKLSNWCKYLHNLRASQDAIEAEIERLCSRQDAIEKRVVLAKKYIALSLPAGSTWRDAVSSLSWRRSERVEPRMRVEQMREMFVRVKETREFNKDFAKRFIKENGPQAEAEITEHWNLQVQ